MVGKKYLLIWMSYGGVVKLVMSTEKSPTVTAEKSPTPKL